MALIATTVDSVIIICNRVTCTIIIIDWTGKVQGIICCQLLNPSEYQTVHNINNMKTLSQWYHNVYLFNNWSFDQKPREFPRLSQCITNSWSTHISQRNYIEIPLLWPTFFKDTTAHSLIGDQSSKIRHTLAMTTQLSEVLMFTKTPQPTLCKPKLLPISKS